MDSLYVISCLASDLTYYHHTLYSKYIMVNLLIKGETDICVD